MRIIIRCLLILAPLTLTACGASPPSHSVKAGGYVGGSVPVECAPFARALSGVHLSGAAGDWWWQAEGRYVRGKTPDVGSVLVLERSGRLPSGHVAVVSKVLSDRHILVTQANWVRHRITEDQPVIDVSSRGDWSAVRVWWPPSAQMGATDYAAHGFIRAMRPASHEQLAAATPQAIRIAIAGR